MEYLSQSQKELLRKANEFQESRQGKGDDKMWFFYTGVLLGIIGHLTNKIDSENKVSRPIIEDNQNLN